MAANQQDIILDIIVKYEDAIKGISDYNSKIEENKKRIQDLKKEQKDLSDQLKSGAISHDEYSSKIDGVNQELAATTVQMNNNKKAVSEYNNEIKNNIATEQQQEGSLNSLRAQLSNLTKEYNSMSEAQRKGAEGQALVQNINQIRSEVTSAEKDVGNFRSEVGNYQNAILNTVGANSAFGQSLLAMAQTAGTGGNMIEMLGTKAKAFFTALLANPIILIITAILAVIMALKKGIESNNEAMDRLQVLLAPINALFKVLMSALMTVVDWVLKGAEAFMGFAMGLSKLAEKLPIVGGLFKEVNGEIERNIQLSRDKKALEDEVRDLTVKDAKSQMEAAKLLADSRDKEKFSAQERLKFLQQANDIEQGIADGNLKVAKERQRLFEEENKARIAQNSLSTAQLDEYAKLQADVFKSDEQRFEKQQGLMRRMNQTKNEIASDDKKKADDAKKAADDAIAKSKEQYQKQTEAIRKAQDTALALVMEGFEKQRQKINLSADREIEDLKHKLETEKNLTQAAREAINQTILNIEQKRKQDLSKLSDEEIKQQIDKEQKRIELQLSAVKKGEEDAHQLRLDKIELDRQAELQSNKMLAEELRQDESLINAKYDKQRQDEVDATNKIIIQKQKDAIDLEFKERLSNVMKGSIEESQIRLDQARSEYDNLLNMDSETKKLLFQNDTDYTNALLDNKNKLRDAEESYKKAQLDSVAIQIGAAAQISDGLSQVLDSFAQNNESLADFAKTMAIFNIGLSTAEAIAKGIAAAQSVPFPGNLAAIATTIATVLANIAKANQILSKQNTPKAPKFATGGLVSGAGSETSDSIPVNLSSGESVLTAQATSFFSPILSAFNQIGGGVPISSSTIVNNSGQQIGMDMLSQAFRLALQDMPAPVVSVEEINNTNQRVQVLERLRTI